MAIQESCCTATREEIKAAAEWNFKLNNWPYFNAKQEVKDCFYKMDRMSPINLFKSGAMKLLAPMTAIAVVIVATAVF